MFINLSAQIDDIPIIIANAAIEIKKSYKSIPGYINDKVIKITPEQILAGEITNKNIFIFDCPNC